MAASATTTVELSDLPRAHINGDKAARSDNDLHNTHSPRSDDAASTTSGDGAPAETVVATPHGRQFSATKSTLIIAVLTGVSFLNTMGSGILTVSLPVMAGDLALDDSLLLWPASVYALAAGCTLLLFGAVGDLVGPRRLWLAGAALYGLFTLGVGLARTGAQLIAFRTVLGVAIAMCLPTALSVTVHAFRPGRWRNMAFACQGMGQPLGYSFGLILGGVFAGTDVGWRWGFYASAILNFLLVLAAFPSLPAPAREKEFTFRSLLRDVDWIGACCLSLSLGLLSYVFSVVSRDYNSLKSAQNIVLLVLAVLLIPGFALWAEWQERRGRPALIPNSLWRNAAFTSTCITVFFTWAVFNAFQYFSALFFERVLHLSALQAAIRFLPMVFVGAATNVVTGYCVDKVHVRDLVAYSAVISMVCPLIMALIQPSWIYWQGAFIAMLLIPLHPDVLFTVSSLIISKAYPGKSQSLAGAVFNAISQVGNSVGLAVTAAISSSVTQHRGAAEADEEKLLAGYHAAFWTMFASMVVVVFVSFFGLKQGGKVGASK
ncbi:integral membrane protein [Apiospora marii]|uniref:Integral membrane protein n=1 Tax=Apiospora marii TaxID=335849 RepID=A0ABR1RFV3_9PEZI